MVHSYRIKPFTQIVLCTLLVLIGLLIGNKGYAHGAYPEAYQIHRGEDGSILVNTAIGVFLRSAGSTRWSYLCPQATRRNSVETQDILRFNSTWFFAGFNGIYRYRENECTVTETYAQTTIALATNQDALFGLSSSGNQSNGILRESEGIFHAFGDTFSDLSESMLGLPNGEFLITSGDGFDVWQIRRLSKEGAIVETHNFPFQDDETRALIRSANPQNPAEIVVTIQSALRTNIAHRLLLSRDGGQSFATIDNTTGIRDAYFTRDGRLLFARFDPKSEMTRGLFHFDTKTNTTTMLENSLHITCIQEIENELWLCTDPLRDDVFVSKWEADASSPIFDFGDISPDPICSNLERICRGELEDLKRDYLNIEPASANDDGCNISNSHPLIIYIYLCYFALLRKRSLRFKPTSSATRED